MRLPLKRISSMIQMILKRIDDIDGCMNVCMIKKD
jgi:hypothetical protein